MNELFYKDLKHTKHVALAGEALLVVRHEQVELQKILRVKGEAEQRAKGKVQNTRTSHTIGESTTVNRGIELRVGTVNNVIRLWKKAVENK
jgi:hypothetical protein